MNGINKYDEKFSFGLLIVQIVNNCNKITFLYNIKPIQWYHLVSAFHVSFMARDTADGDIVRTENIICSRDFNPLACRPMDAILNFEMKIKCSILYPCMVEWRRAFKDCHKLLIGAEGPDLDRKYTKTFLLNYIICPYVCPFSIIYFSFLFYFILQ